MPGLKYILIFPFLFSLNSLFAQAFDASELDEIVEMESRRWRTAQQKSDGSFNGTEYNWNFAECYWNIDPWDKYISGSVIHHISLLKVSSAVTFDFNQSMQVNDVLVDGVSTPFSFPNQYTLRVEFEEELLPSEQVIEIKYEGEPISEGRASFNQSFHDSDKPEIYTLSEPYGSKDWWPCKHTLADKLDSVHIEITVPQGNKAGSNGLLEEELDNGDGTLTFKWHHGYPIPAYLVSLAVTNYAEFSQYVEVDGQEIHILNYIYPERLDIEMERGEATPDLMLLFSELFGMYPYADEKYGHSQTSIPGGMEHTTMSTMTNLLFGLNAHELAHQWFGDKVTCGSWTDIWLNEGFATYATGLSYEHIGEEGSWENWKRNMIDQVTSKPDGSVYVDDTLSRERIFDGRLSYRKGSGVLHMLRKVIGDEAFYAGIQSYLNDEDLAFNYVYTPDFQVHLEAASGISLEYFFQDWIYGEGFPSFDVAWGPVEGGTAIKLAQTPSHSSVDFFELPVDLLLRGIEQDSLVTFYHSFNGQTFFVNPGFEVKSVVFDPDLWLIAKATVRVDTDSDYPDFLIIPNPATDNIRVSILNPSFRADKVEVVDSQGRVVQEFIPENELREGFKLYIGHFSSGQYYLRMLSGKYSKAIPFVKI